MNLPNKLTVGRLFLTVIFVIITSTPNGWGTGWAYTAGMIIFGIASATDYLDGYWARKFGLVTSFGKLMDPLVDKVLLCSAFVMLSSTRLPGGVDQLLIPWWITVAVLAREFLVTGLRLVASSQGHVMAADSFGKQKTVWQITTASYFIVFLACQEPAMKWLRPLFDVPWLGPHSLGALLIGIMTVTTIASGGRYFWNNRAAVLKEL